MRRRSPDRGRRDDYREFVARLDGMCGAEFGSPYSGQIEALDRGDTVRVQYGWEIDLPHVAGPLLLHADGTVTPS